MVIENIIRSGEFGKNQENIGWIQKQMIYFGKMFFITNQ